MSWCVCLMLYVSAWCCKDKVYSMNLEKNTESLFTILVNITREEKRWSDPTYRFVLQTFRILGSWLQGPWFTVEFLCYLQKSSNFITSFIIFVHKNHFDRIYQYQRNHCFYHSYNFTNAVSNRTVAFPFEPDTEVPWQVYHPSHTCKENYLYMYVQLYLLNNIHQRLPMSIYMYMLMLIWIIKRSKHCTLDKALPKI